LSDQIPHLRARDGGEQTTTALELFFDLVYVFAVTQLSHLMIGDLSWVGAAHAGFLLLVIWWAWIYTTWMVNWFDPASTRVRLVLIAVMLASLLMAAAIPGAFGGDRELFAASYVVLQVGRNLAGMLLLPQGHRLRRNFERIVVWSVVSGVLWLIGGLVGPGQELPWWLAALAVDLAAPFAGYWTPRLGRSLTGDYEIEGGHFAERCQGFIIIALGESIVVTGATASGAGLSSTVVLCLALAFAEAAALWWLYFDEVAGGSRRDMAETEDAGALARDAYTYLHVPIVAGVILSAVGDDLLIAHPDVGLSAVGAASVLGGPALFLLGESLFRRRMISSTSTKRILAIAALALMGVVAGWVSALVLSGLVVALLIGLAGWEFKPPHRARGAVG
jgi:low temperature requirement protein LtrA